MITRLAFLSLLLLGSTACVGNRAGAGPPVPVNSRAPLLVVANETGTDYEIFIMFTGVDNGRPLGTAVALRDTPLQLFDIPGNSPVRFRAQPMGAATGGQILYSDPVEVDEGRQMTWSLGLFRSSQVTYRTNR